MILTNGARKKGHVDSLSPKFNENGVLVLGSRALKGLTTPMIEVHFQF